MTGHVSFGVTRPNWRVVFSLGEYIPQILSIKTREIERMSIMTLELSDEAVTLCR